jgi:hypothetical protein
MRKSPVERDLQTLSLSAWSAVMNYNGVMVKVSPFFGGLRRAFSSFARKKLDSGFNLWLWQRQHCPRWWMGGHSAPPDNRAGGKHDVQFWAGLRQIRNDNWLVRVTGQRTVESSQHLDADILRSSFALHKDIKDSMLIIGIQLELINSGLSGFRRVPSAFIFILGLHSITSLQRTGNLLGDRVLSVDEWFFGFSKYWIISKVNKTHFCENNIFALLAGALPLSALYLLWIFQQDIPTTVNRHFLLEWWNSVEWPC